jgi:DNA modification methylase
MFAHKNSSFAAHFRDVQVEWLDVAMLCPYGGNPRTHSKKQVRQIAASIEQFGFTNPILIDGAGVVLAGHGRLEAAKLLGWPRVPSIRLETLNPAQCRAYVLADNKLAELAGWDESLLAIELQGLIEIDPTFELGVIGFEPHEIDLVIEGAHQEEPGDPLDDLLPASHRTAVSRLGDLWLLGPHRLLCGDATDAQCFEVLLGNEQAQMVFTDPPYNVPIGGHVSGLGAVQHREFVSASGEMSRSEFVSFLKSSLGNLARFSIDGSIHFICMDWRHMGEMLGAGTATYSEFKQLCCWVKDNGGMGSFYRSRHELVFVFKAGTSSHLNNFELGQHGRYRTNVWNYKGANSFGKNRTAELALHPTVKPVQMIADAIKDVSERNGIVLDCFAGSGSTLIAAQKTGRRARLLELDRLYVDTIIRRYQIYGHDDAVLAATGQTFAQVTAERASLASESEPLPSNTDGQGGSND